MILKTGLLVGSPISTILSDTTFIFGDLDGTPAKKVTVDRIYTSTPLGPSDNLSYIIENLEVNKNGTNQVLISTPTTFTVNGFNEPITTVFRAYNYIYPGRNIAGNVWATGNLYYTATPNPDLQYKIDLPKTSANPENCNYYFNWNTLLTRSGINDLNHSTGDPCSLVYPAGKWKTPSEDDFNLLLTSENVNFSNEGTGAIKF